MSYKTNANSIRLKYLVGWKSSFFPINKIIYPRDLSITLKSYLFLKGYLWLKNYKLLSCEWRQIENLKTCYLTILKTKSPKKKQPSLIYKLKKVRHKQALNLWYKSYLKSNIIKGNVKFKNIFFFKHRQKIHFWFLFLWYTQALTLKKIRKSYKIERQICTIFPSKYKNYYKLLKIKFQSLLKRLKFIKHKKENSAKMNNLMNLLFWQTIYYKTKRNDKSFLIANFGVKKRTNFQNKYQYIQKKLKQITKKITQKSFNNYLQDYQIKKRIYYQTTLSKNIFQGKLINKSNKLFYRTIKDTLFHNKMKILLTKSSLKKIKNLKLLWSYFYLNFMMYKNKHRAKSYIKYKFYHNKKINKKFTYLQRIINKYTKQISIWIYLNKKYLCYKEVNQIQTYKYKNQSKLAQMTFEPKMKVGKQNEEKKLFHLKIMTKFQLKYHLQHLIKKFYKIGCIIKILQPMENFNLLKETSKKFKQMSFKQPINKESQYTLSITKDHKKILIPKTLIQDKTNIESDDEEYNRWKTKGIVTRLAPLLAVLPHYLEPQILVEQIAYEFEITKQHNFVLHDLSQILTEFGWPHISAYKICISGRINSASRTKKKWLLSGNLLLNTYSKKVVYSLAHARARMGSFGIKIWLAY